MQSRIASWLMFAAPVLLLLSNTPGAAVTRDNVGLPTAVCRGEFCGPRQHQIWTQFQQGESLSPESLRRVYAGVCFVNREGDDPNHEHHVGFLFDEASGRPHLLLRFSFFADAQPYDRLDIQQARFRFSGPILPVSFHDGFAYAHVLGKQFFARYWFRRDPSSRRLLLVSYFGYRTTILCDATENAL